jgi:hypothetical protein
MRNVVIVVAAILLGGCSEADPNLVKLHPVTGVVTLDGEPLPRASVVFVPQGNTPGSGTSAITDDAGRYALATMHQGAGAPEGSYKVVISKLVQPDGSEFPLNAEVDPMSTPHKEFVPKPYSDPEATTLTADVASGGGSIDFPLRRRP